MAKTRPIIKCIDFFCGAGGLTRGLLDAGIEVLAGVDNDDRLKSTYEKNNAPSGFVDEDIATLDIKKLRRRFGIRKSDLVLYAACTPCQPFSSLNQRRGADERKDLLRSFGRIVAEAPPDLLLVENVPGLGNAYGRDLYHEFLRVLRDCGFLYDARKLDAQDYGVPQVRKRFLLVGSRRGRISLPKGADGSPRTVRDAIGRLAAPGSDDAPPNHVFREPKPHHLAIIRAVPHDGGSRRDVPDTSLLLKCHQRNPNVHKDVFGRMAWDAPAPTMTCRCTDVYCGRFTHPEQDRGLTLREAAALQTFRDDYEFDGTFFHVAAQIGNAVPVRLAQRLGETFVEIAQAH